ncbi:MAG: transcription elongation factor GreB [Commensalibacter sp.]|nr:transcription elongation factor GreB [Commensalibacter sp.]
MSEIASTRSPYITPNGYARLKQELEALLHEERPRIVEIVSWAAGNGDRSENGDYLYGKKRLREIDRRVRFLSKRLENAVVVNPAEQHKRDQVFFGATVTYVTEDDIENQITIVGVDEARLEDGQISLASPIAKALMRAKIGDEVKFISPKGEQILEILSISYPDV